MAAEVRLTDPVIPRPVTVPLANVPVLALSSPESLRMTLFVPASPSMTSVPAIKSTRPIESACRPVVVEPTRISSSSPPPCTVATVWALVLSTENVSLPAPRNTWTFSVELLTVSFALLTRRVA